MFAHAVRSLAVARSPARSLARREWFRDFSRSRRRSVPTVRSGARHKREPRRSRPRSIDRIASAESPKCPPPRRPGKSPSSRRAHVPAQSRGRTRFHYPPIDRSIESRSSASPRSKPLASLARTAEQVSEIETGDGDKDADGNAVPDSLSIDREPTGPGDGCSCKRSPTRFRSGIDRSVYDRTR